MIGNGFSLWKEIQAKPVRVVTVPIMINFFMFREFVVFDLSNHVPNSIILRNCNSIGY